MSKPRPVWSRLARTTSGWLAEASRSLGQPEACSGAREASGEPAGRPESPCFHQTKGALLALCSCSLALDLAAADLLPGDKVTEEVNDRLVRDRLRQMGVEVDDTARSLSEEGHITSAAEVMVRGLTCLPSAQGSCGGEAEGRGRRRSGSRSGAPHSPRPPPAPSPLAPCPLAPGS